MKNRILSFLMLVALLVLLFPVAWPQAKALPQDSISDIRVMSANVQAEFASWTSSGVAPESTSTRVERFNKMLDENKPLVVGTQEMSPSWYTAFNKLDTTKWGWLTESDVAGYSYYNYVPNKGLALNSILYRKDLLTLNSHGVEAYTKRNNGQCIVWGVFTLNSTGKQFVFISTHWTPGTGNESYRLAQAEQLAQRVNELRRIYGDTVVVTGDFNCNDESQEYRRFLINSNSLDSRTDALVRGDSLSKIDHISATFDGSFTYHTVCYEANNAYAISDHPFVVADIKLGNSMIFDFTDTAESRAHYKQGAYRYNAYDYHEKYWVYQADLCSNRVINKTEGTLSFNVSASGNPYIIASTNEVTDPTGVYGLNYNTEGAEIAQIRFRLSGCQQINSSVSPTVTVSSVKRSVGRWMSDKASYSLSKANSGYITLNIPLTKDGFCSVEQLDSIRLSFDNIKNGSVKIDYIYIGRNNTNPLNQALFFDYSNTSADQSRYSGSAYKGYNFDRSSSAYWTTAGYGTTKDFSINNTAGTMTVKVKNTNELGPVIATAPSTGSYQWNTSGTCLSYKPTNAQVMQIRFMLTGCQAISGKPSRVLLMYGGMYNGAFKGDNYENLAPYTVANGKYITLTIPLSDTFRQASEITKLGLRFQYIQGTPEGSITIDYIYVGPENGVPTDHVYNHKVTAPTCTTDGYTTHSCTRCAYSYKDAVIKAAGHRYHYDYTTIPTIFGEGLLTGICSGCSDTITVPMPKLNTTDYTKIVVTPATCTANGTDKYIWKTTTYGTFSINTNTAALGHSYIYTKQNALTHLITCKNCDYFAEAAHSYKDGFCVCGEPEIKEPKEDASLKLNHSLNLACDISVNYAVPKSLLEGFDMATVYVLVETDIYEGNSKTGTTTAKLLPVDQGNYYYFILDGMTAVQMNDRLRAVLYGTKDAQSYYSATDDYSIADYAYSQMNKGTASEKLKTLCADLLRYGSKAQIFKAYRTDALADASMTNTHMSYLSDMETVTFGNTNKVLDDLENPAITWAGKSLDLESKVALKFVFDATNYSGDVSKLTMKVSYKDISGAAKTVTVKNVEAYNEGRKLYSFTVDALLAAELRMVVSVQIFEGDAPVSCTLQYSADTYGNNKSGNLLTLCKALFAYSDSAKAYFS